MLDGRQNSVIKLGRFWTCFSLSSCHPQWLSVLPSPKLCKTRGNIHRKCCGHCCESPCLHHFGKFVGEQSGIRGQGLSWTAGFATKVSGAIFTIPIFTPFIWFTILFLFFIHLYVPSPAYILDSLSCLILKGPLSLSQPGWLFFWTRRRPYPALFENM